MISAAIDAVRQVSDTNMRADVGHTLVVLFVLEHLSLSHLFFISGRVLAFVRLLMLFNACSMCTCMVCAMMDDALVCISLFMPFFVG